MKHLLENNAGAARRGSRSESVPEVLARLGATVLTPSADRRVRQRLARTQVLTDAEQLARLRALVDTHLPTGHRSEIIKAIGTLTLGKLNKS